MRAGLLTPMANPTVEAEFRTLLPPSIEYVVARLTSSAGRAEDRLVGYAEQSHETVRQFGGMHLDAIGFACTASSYLIGSEREAAIAASFDLPFIFAARAVSEQIKQRGLRSIAVISPYPASLHESGLVYWHEEGLEVIYEARIEIESADTKSIYGLTGNEAKPLLAEAIAAAPELILLSGTGMPTQHLIDPDGAIPILSSNYCLAAALQERAGD